LTIACDALSYWSPNKTAQINMELQLQFIVRQRREEVFNGNEDECREYVADELGVPVGELDDLLSDDGFYTLEPGNAWSLAFEIDEEGSEE